MDVIRSALRDMNEMHQAGATSVEGRKADSLVREHLTEMLLALPPSAVVSSKALATFKQQHVEMMKMSTNVSPQDEARSS